MLESGHRDPLRAAFIYSDWQQRLSRLSHHLPPKDLKWRSRDLNLGPSACLALSCGPFPSLRPWRQDSPGRKTWQPASLSTPYKVLHLRLYLLAVSARLEKSAGPNFLPTLRGFVLTVFVQVCESHEAGCVCMCGGNTSIILSPSHLRDESDPEVSIHVYPAPSWAPRISAGW